MWFIRQFYSSLLSHQNSNHKPALQPLYGLRWKCQDCYDFDYCFKCYWTAKETHPDHNFEKLGTGPETSPEYDEDVSDSNTDEDEDDDEDSS
jgi:hypothetical protein